MEQSKKYNNILNDISNLAHKAMPSSEYLRYDSSFYSKEKVELYELCKSIIKVCNQGGDK